MNRVVNLTTLSIIFLSLILVVARFLYIGEVPNGFYVDEVVAGSNILSFKETYANFYGESWPLFSKTVNIYTGQTSPTYLYIGWLWSFIFGTSIESFRALSAFVTVITIFILSILIKRHLSKEHAIWIFLIASLSPWAWQFSRIAWDNPMAPMFFMGGFLLLIEAKNIVYIIGAGLLFALSAYTYSPLFVQTVVFLLALAIFFRSYIGLKNIFFTFLSMLIFLIPMLTKSITGSNARFSFISIFSDYKSNPTANQDLFHKFVQFLDNLYLHLKPSYLLFFGDANFRHGTGYAGLISWFDVTIIFMFILLFLLNKKLVFNKIEKRWLFIGIIGYISAIIPPALTWSGIPHALRSLGGWPFLSIIITILVLRFIKTYKYISIFFIILLYISTFGFLYVYFYLYKEDSKYYFDFSVKEAVLKAQNGDYSEWKKIKQNYPPIALTYYEIEYLNPNLVENKFGKIKLLNLDKGWNLVALPVNKSLSNPKEFFKSDVYTFKNKKWYKNLPILNAQDGFWIDMKVKQSFQFKGDEYKLNINSLIYGWNLVGSGENMKSYKIENKELWVFRNKKWQKSPLVIFKGEGCWIKR